MQKVWVNQRLLFLKNGQNFQIKSKNKGLSELKALCVLPIIKPHPSIRRGEEFSASPPDLSSG